jgi:xanthine dehydrogenase accessory factor
MAKGIPDVPVEMRARKQPFAVAAVMGTVGPVPAKAGSEAVIDRDGQAVADWVGGGCA